MAYKKKVLIIGATSGIGKKLSENLLKEGYEVFGTGRNLNEKSVIDGVKGIEIDVLNFDESIFENLGDYLDALIYCPGNINLKPFNRTKDEDFINDFSLNVIGATNIIKSVLSKLKKGNDASIVMFSTVAVQTGMTFHAVTATVKAAVEGLTKSLAAEFAPTIRVNCIAPSLTETPLAEMLLNNEKKKESAEQRHPLKKIGSPQDLADIAEFLLSDKSKWITGQIIHVDGGMSTLR
jgi:NAD(P)-dependent dehydrogenase (short-subunit alcohol dehydrogenase family)